MALTEILVSVSFRVHGYAKQDFRWCSLCLLDVVSVSVMWISSLSSKAGCSLYIHRAVYDNFSFDLLD